MPLYLSSLDCTHRESQPLPKSSKNAASLATHCTANNVANAKHATPAPCRTRIGYTGSANASPISHVYCACKLCVRTRCTSEGLGGVNEVRAQQRVCCSVIGQEAKANLYSSLDFACMHALCTSKRRALRSLPVDTPTREQIYVVFGIVDCSPSFSKRDTCDNLHSLINPWQSQSSVHNASVKCFMRDYYIYGALLTFSLALFGNTWSAGFAFDDNFAVVGVSSAINVLV